MSSDMQSGYFSYWGKAKPSVEDRARYHLLVYHSLDVAACGQALLSLPQFSLEPLAQELGWPLSTVERLFVFFLGLHDLGKFARAFQGLAPNLSPALVAADKGKSYDCRHDALGWMLWNESLADGFPDDRLPEPDDEFWAIWIRSVCGHHGMPPLEDGGGLVRLRTKKFFLADDIDAAREFTRFMSTWALPDDIPRPGRKHKTSLCRHSWRLAGLAVLADWLGSNQAFFAYQEEPKSLQKYWHETALPQGKRAVRAAGLQQQVVRSVSDSLQLFDYLQHPTPLQQYAANVELEAGPQIFLLEDVTGAGKTEAALILAYRMMQAGSAAGLYFALPSMATANQMYQRVGSVYQRLYEAGAEPSLILAHGARQLMEGFRQSVVQSEEPPGDRNYHSQDASATAQCNAWLADNRKKALLADVGVGTLDQALLAVLPVRHQSLRLLGLSGKVLVVDEVHAYDSYMVELLKKLLTAHARQGGSAILLSATLPARLREDLSAAYRFGLGAQDDELVPDSRYPLATQIGRKVAVQACAARPQSIRRLQVAALHDEDSVLAMIAGRAAEGHCVCWVRNTVDDARRAFMALREHMPADNLMLFHSRYAMGDRLDIEERALTRFGKRSTAVMRRGQVLIATQVVEQSLDLDFDVMVSDLAPVDLLIQRAGRLQRHVRSATGEPSVDGVEKRLAPVFHLLTPEPVDEPSADWYKALFPKACYVYPDAGRLWLGARALLQAGSIVTPGEVGQAGSVRELVEAVYGDVADLIPPGLQRARRDEDGRDLAKVSQARFNALYLDKGYCVDSSERWDEDTRVPTRLGDETLTLYLARDENGGLVPWCGIGAHSWEQSAVRIDARRVESLSLEWQNRFAEALQQLRSSHRLLEEPAVVLPLVDQDGAGWVGEVVDGQGRQLELRYDRVLGLMG